MFFIDILATYWLLMGVLRFLLALSVIIDHSKPIFGITLLPSELALESFFMISGFYMAMVITEKYSKVPNSYKLFITNRFLRIFPLYWLVMLITIMAFAIDGYATGDFHTLRLYYDYFNLQSLGTKVYLITSNLIIFGQEFAYFFGADKNGILHATSNSLKFQTPFYRFFIDPALWSVSIELAFYLISPMLLKLKRSFVILIITLLLFIRLILKLENVPYDPFIYRLLPFQFVFFLLGILAYHFYRFIETVNIPRTFSLGMFIIILLFTISYRLLPRSEFLDSIYFTSFLITMPFVFKFSKTLKIDRFIAELSYPMYITHILVLAFTGKVLILFHRGERWFSLAGAVLTIAVSFLLIRFVSYYIEKYRAKRISRDLRRPQGTHTPMQK